MRNLLITFLIIAPIFLFAQGEFLDKDSSGVGLEGAFSLDENTYGFGFNIGYSFKGAIDLGFSYSKTNGDNNSSINSISPNINLHIGKENPISLTISIVYISSLVSNEFLDSNNLNLKIKGIGFGGTLYGNFFDDHRQNFYLLPHFGIFFSDMKTTLTDNFGNSDSYRDNTKISILGFAFIFKTKSNVRIFLDPSFALNNDSASISIGIVIPK